MISQGMVCGTGLSNQPKPGDPSNYSILRASPTFGGIHVSWTFPLLNPFAVAHTLLYRGTNADFNNAAELSVVAGSSYLDQFSGGDPVLYYYWIKFVSVNGTYGDVIGPASCWANPTVDSIMELLTDRIDNGVLARALKGEIERITFLADGLTQEVTYRQEEDATLAHAYNGLQASFDHTVSLVLTETNLRSTADSSLAQQITTVQSQLGDNLASVQQLMQTNVQVINGKLVSIGALYTVKLSVNGLVGGFGAYNDGRTVEAGFDVDLFWIGRTQADKRKPFIINDGIVYIDNAMIHQLTADKIDTRNLTVKDNSGNVILGSGISLNPTYAADGTRNSDLTSSIASAAQRAIWANVSGANRPEDNATWGADFDRNMKGKIHAGNIWTYIDAAVIGGAFIGDAAISNAKIGNAEISTLKIQGNAVSFGASIGLGGAADFGTSVGGTLVVIGYSDGSNSESNLVINTDAGGKGVAPGAPIMIFYDDGYIRGQYVDHWGPCTCVASFNMGPGNHHIEFSQDNNRGGQAMWMFFQR